MNTKPTPDEIIALCGGTTAVARYLRIRPPSVSGWRTEGVPFDKLVRLAPIIEERSDGKHTRMTLLPQDWWHIWPELAAANPDKVPADAMATSLPVQAA
ncbi:MAG: hypothetical protein ACEQSH_00625 [Bacteroidia bacterium]